MRTKRLVYGLDNSQKVRIICNGVGFVTTVRGALDMCFSHQRTAVLSILTSLGYDQFLPVEKRPTGLATRLKVYQPGCKAVDGKMTDTSTQVEVDVQVDLL